MNLKHLIVLTCLTLPGAGIYAQTAKIPDALELAQKADRALQTFSQASAESLVRFDFKGRSGFSRTRAMIGKPGQFSIQYTNLSARTPPEGGEIRSDGKKKAYLAKGAANAKDAWKPIASVQPPFFFAGRTMVERFPIEFPRLVFSPLVTGRGSITEYIREARKLGYTIEVTERKAQANGQDVFSWRVSVTNPKSAHAKNGVQRVDLVLDRNLGLPVTIYMLHNHPDGKRTRITWTIAWRRIPMPPESSFALPATLR